MSKYRFRILSLNHRFQAICMLFSVRYILILWFISFMNWYADLNIKVTSRSGQKFHAGCKSRETAIHLVSELTKNEKQKNVSSFEDDTKKSGFDRANEVIKKSSMRSSISFGSCKSINSTECVQDVDSNRSSHSSDRTPFSVSPRRLDRSCNTKYQFDNFGW